MPHVYLGLGTRGLRIESVLDRHPVLSILERIGLQQAFDYQLPCAEVAHRIPSVLGDD